MIIDAHVHTFPAGALPGAMHDATAREWAYGVWPHRDPAAIRHKIEPGFTDPDGSTLIADLDAAGVDAGVIMMLDHGIGFGEEAPLSVPALLAHYGEVQARYPGRLYAFAAADPRRPDAVELLKAGVHEHGLRGLKLYPPNGYHPGDPVCHPLLAACTELGVPVLVHTAMMTYPLRGHYANPLYMAEVQKRYPDLSLIFGHAGYSLWAEEAALTVAGHESSYLEISQWDRLLGSDEERLIRTLGRMRDHVGPHRILYGSDHISGPRYSGARNTLPDLVAFLRDLPERAAPYGVTFTREESDLILGGNAARILGIGEETGKP